MTDEKPDNAVVVSPADAPPQTPNYPEETALTPFEGDFMEVTIEVSQHLEKYEKALNTIMNFIIKRTYPGDWVSHDKSGTPLEERTANPSGAAMERVARDLGIQESNRTKPTKHFHGDEHPGHYYYQCEGYFEFRGRKINAMGMASTLNPFYYKSGGQMKEPHDIREEYIIRDCLRDCVKQGVKGLFGLRKIPITKLAELGYDISKIKYVNYQSGEQSATKTRPDSTAVPQDAQKPEVKGEALTLTVTGITAKVSKNGKSFFTVTDAEGATYFAWGNDQSELIVALKTARQATKPVQVMVEGLGGKYPTILAVV